MSIVSTPLFSFSERDHLTRIHLRLSLEDLGFAVEERADELTLGAPAGQGDVATPSLLPLSGQ